MTNVTEILDTHPDPDVDNVPVLSLQDYQCLIREAEVQAPTDEQIANFVDFVCGAKSWYKHLPLVLPGESMYFFIDACAGLDRILLADGRVTFLQRSESLRFHYTWMPTSEYRERFGRLSFACAAASELFMELQMGDDTTNELIPGVLDPNWIFPVIWTSQENRFRLPQEILDAGCVEVTGVLHALTDRPEPWKFYAKEFEAGRNWPDESGGLAAFSAILARCEALNFSSTQHEADPEISAIVGRERARLKRDMVSAIIRVRSIVYE
ncbi:MAG: hypothetical protein Q8L02_00860 [Candidatus Nitrotoga sp.]|nr:hypothetical protein [Candidatus Nitrotoga sp.]